MDTYIDRYKSTAIRIIIAVGVLLVAFLLISTFVKIKEYRYIGSGMQTNNTITVTGTGKIERAPDTARVTFTVRNESKNVKAAQDVVGEKVNVVKKALMDAGIDEKYIQTESYSSYPQYDYTRSICTTNSCPPVGTPVIRGYEVAHVVIVSIKDLEKIETVLGILAGNQVSDIQGPNFGFEDDKAIAREARELAIKDAREEAEKLAKQLGVDLVRIVSFSEGGSPMPVYARNQSFDMKESATVGGAPVPEIPVGVQNITSNVTVIYEIR